uniref:Helicase swr1-like n=1 Tax=Dermatophagoides pteronyssinus TaxID=6956 RepID=A0A6P6YKH4_DERPT|nr:helicase swr1-like [Dermatophagoides pteronyssinus]
MGLGKTVQSIALLTHLATWHGIWGPHLIVVPSSVLYNWHKELLKFAPSFRVVVYDGKRNEREKKRKGMFRKLAVNVVLVSYNVAVTDVAHLRRLQYYYLVLDEAHLIKNFNCARWRSILSYNCQLRLLLTGTPLQNNLLELWALMYMVVPGLFGNHHDFGALFNSPLLQAISTQSGSAHVAQIVEMLHKVLRPFLLRRLKVHVEQELPKKTERVVRCILTLRQQKLYHDLIYAFDKSAQSAANQPSTFSRLSFLYSLKKVCDHPYMVKPDYREAAILRAAKADGRKVLIFTQITAMLDHLERFLAAFGHRYVRFDSKLKISQRQVVIDRFNSDPHIGVFITSTRVGGVGINLTGASVIVFYDTDWNPAVDRQAMDRCHRIGQSRDVQIFRLISEFTLEENIWRSTVVLFAGLQGSGKTTSVAKIALYCKKLGFSVGVICCDTFRAGAFEQLRANCKAARVEFFGSQTLLDPVDVVQKGLHAFRTANKEVILIDTSGRHKQSESLFRELKRIEYAAAPNYITLVVDGFAGQSCFEQAKAFADAFQLSNIVVTKLDDGLRSGAALSAVAAARRPVWFVGTGEQLSDLQLFEPALLSALCQRYL